MSRLQSVLRYAACHPGALLRLLLAPALIAAEYARLRHTALSLSIAAALSIVMDSGPREQRRELLSIAADMLFALAGLSALAAMRFIPGVVPVSAAAAFATHIILYLDRQPRPHTRLGGYAFTACLALIAGIQYARIYSLPLYRILATIGTRSVALFLWLCVLEHLLRGWKRSSGTLPAGTE